MIRVAILASGTGTNAMKLLYQAQSLTQLEIPLIIVDQKSSLLLNQVPLQFPNVRVHLIEAPKAESPDLRRKKHETEILTLLQKYKIEWCFLAGYMRLIGPTLLNAFQGEKNSKIVNIHPSLLPKYPGLHAYEEAFHAGEKVSGITIHFVDGGLDTGPIILQRSFERAKEDRLEDFIQRGKSLEWALYPEVLSKLNDQGEL